jgi:hypothetical protein
MTTSEQPPPTAQSAEHMDPASLKSESEDTVLPHGGELEPGQDPVKELSTRVDSMREWASTIKSQIRGLLSGVQVLGERTAALETLREAVDLIGTQVGELSSAAAVSAPEAKDSAVGYQPSVEQQAQLFQALAEWQSTAKPLEKAQTANIQTKAGATVSYRYADIASVSEVARSAGAIGLAHFHREIVVFGQSFVRTYLVHKGGGWICCDVPLLLKENTLISSLQQWASACTMARRYGLFMVLGIAAGEEDDDGANAGRRNQPPPAGANQTTGPRAAPARTPSTR